MHTLVPQAGLGVTIPHHPIELASSIGLHSMQPREMGGLRDRRLLARSRSMLRWQLAVFHAPQSGLLQYLHACTGRVSGNSYLVTITRECIDANAVQIRLTHRLLPREPAVHIGKWPSSENGLYRYSFGCLIKTGRPSVTVGDINQPSKKMCTEEHAPYHERPPYHDGAPDLRGPFTVDVWVHRATQRRPCGDIFMQKG